MSGNDLVEHGVEWLGSGDPVSLGKINPNLHKSILDVLGFNEFCNGLHADNMANLID